MAARVGPWVAGLVVGVALAAAVPESTFPGARPLVLGLSFLGIGLAGEWAATVFHRRPVAVSRARAAAPPDGRVGLAGIAGARREPNRLDARYGRFRGRLPTRMEAPQADEADRRSPPLLGRVVLVSLFLGRDGRAWSVAEIAEAHRALRRAGVWVEREALRYGAGVHLELADTYFVDNHDDPPGEVGVDLSAIGDGLGPLEEASEIKAQVALTRSAARLGFRDADHLLRWCRSEIVADATVWLLHPRGVGRSFAIPREQSVVSAGLAVCYPKKSTFPEPLRGPAHVDPVTVVHELLHLFGATDTYGRPLRTFPPGSVTTRDVMRLDQTRLSRLRVDPRTAAEIGWGVQRPSPNETAGVDLEGPRRP